jgi:hypothetical protein
MCQDISGGDGNRYVSSSDVANSRGSNLRQ